jgi:RNA polymerase sigma-70 factor (ECF subfamily)
VTVKPGVPRAPAAEPAGTAGRGPIPLHPSSGAEIEDVRLAAQGDRTAFDRLVLACQDDVVSAASYYLGNDEDGADAAQEAFLKAYRALPGFRLGSSFKTWVIRIALNTAKSIRMRGRAKKRGGGARRAPGPGDEAGGVEIAGPEVSSSPSALLERKEIKEALEKAIVELEHEAREVIVLRDLSGRSYEEIAAALDLPLGTVKSRVHRARLELQKKLAPYL